MHLKSLIVTCLLATLFIVLKSDVDGPAHHGHGDVTGAPTGVVGHCQVHTCHGGNNANNIVLLQVIDTSTMLPITQYTAWHTYMVKITGNATAISTTLPGFGFQASAVLSNHHLAGSYTIPTSLASNIHTWPCGATTVVEHSVMLAPDTAGINKYSVYFYWTAPTYMSDTVTFYSMLNAVNNDGGDSGDNPDAAPRVVLSENPADSAFASVATIITPEDNFIVYPNPTAGNPTIAYNLLYTQLVSIGIYDIMGRKVVQVADNELQSSGTHTYTPAISISGTYFIRLVAGNVSASRQFVKQ